MANFEICSFVQVIRKSVGQMIFVTQQKKTTVDGDKKQGFVVMWLVLEVSLVKMNFDATCAISD